MIGPVIVPKKKRNKSNGSPASRKRRGLIVILFVFLIAIFYFLFFMNSDKTLQQLKGTWLRSDGTYKIEIKEVLDDGTLEAAYFNPKPIKVGEAAWREKEGKLQIYVELRDINYPGSIYQLTYDEDVKTLFGTYYQAVAQETYEVYFTKEK